MSLLYKNKTLQIDDLIDELKENSELSGIIMQDKENNNEFNAWLTTTISKVPDELKSSNIFSNIFITISKSKAEPVEIVTEDNVKGKLYKDYEEFTLCAYRNLVNPDKRKVLVTSKYVLVPYGPDYKDYEGYSELPIYLVYEH